MRGVAAGSRIPLIKPGAVFTLEQARNTLGLAMHCLPREIRLGRLRVSKRAGRYFLLGEWLLEWLRTGEVRRTKTTAKEGAEG